VTSEWMFFAAGLASGLVAWIGGRSERSRLRSEVKVGQERAEAARELFGEWDMRPCEALHSRLASK
jgi:hypothetical protein